MTRPANRPSAWALVLVVALAPVAPPRTAAAAANPLRVTIAFTGDVSGYLEPCG